MSLNFVCAAAWIVFALVIAAIFNRSIVLSNYVKETFSTMDLFLKRRWDLIPNLIEAIKSRASQEEGIFQEITKLTSNNYSNLKKRQKIDINLKLNAEINKLLTFAENYPDLKANETYNKLINELSSLEDAVISTKKYYNDSVRELNTFTEVFPSNVV